MIRASVSETKNRLSHFIRLVRGGEQVEIMDRDTPVARIVHVAKSPGAAKEATWMTEAQRLGLITLPSYPEDFPATVNLFSPGINLGRLERSYLSSADNRRPTGYYCLAGAFFGPRWIFLF